MNSAACPKRIAWHDWNPKQIRYRHYLERVLNSASYPPDGTMKSASGLQIRPPVNLPALLPTACCGRETRQIQTVRCYEQPHISYTSHPYTVDAHHGVCSGSTALRQRTPRDGHACRGGRGDIMNGTCTEINSITFGLLA